jgi:hypothetical protein
VAANMPGKPALYCRSQYRYFGTQGSSGNNLFVPWAAHIQLKDGTPNEYQHPVEQDRLHELIMAQDAENPEQADLKEQIGRMLAAPRFDIRSPKEFRGLNNFRYRVYHSQ